LFQEEEDMQQDLMRRPRPIGVTIIAILMGIQGLFLLFVGIFALFGAFVPGVGGAFVFLAILTLLLGLLILYFASSLWTLKRWAFWATVIIEIINVVEGLVALFSGRGWVNVPGLIISAIILIYFLADSNVRAAFRV
jgi:FtsH-binding integral membrane protein